MYGLKTLSSSWVIFLPGVDLTTGRKAAAMPARSTAWRHGMPGESTCRSCRRCTTETRRRRRRGRQRTRRRGLDTSGPFSVGYRPATAVNVTPVPSTYTADSPHFVTIVFVITNCTCKVYILKYVRLVKDMLFISNNK